MTKTPPATQAFLISCRAHGQPGDKSLTINPNNLQKKSVRQQSQCQDGHDCQKNYSYSWYIGKNHTLGSKEETFLLTTNKITPIINATLAKTTPLPIARVLSAMTAMMLVTPQ